MSWSRRQAATIADLAKPLAMTCAKCGEQTAILWPYPMPRGTCTCPCSSPPEAIAFVKAMSEKLSEPEMSDFSAT